MIDLKFEVIDLESQIKTLKSFIDIGDDYAKFIAENLGLEASSITENFEEKIEKLYNKNLDSIQKRCIVFQKSWDNKKDFINQELAKVFGQTFDFNCVARVNINPIFPRFLDTKTFDIHFECDEDCMLLNATHEISHFAWFEIFAQNFPSVPFRHYHMPYTPWLISEIAVEPIFRFSALHTLSSKLPTYDYFYTEKIGGQTVAEIANNLYKESKNIKDFQQKMMNFFSQEKTETLIK